MTQPTPLPGSLLGHERFPRLFSPLTIGGVTIKNRIMSSGHDTVMAERGLIGDQLVAYQEARARGGVGLIVTQASGVHPTARYTPTELTIDSDEAIPGYRRLADVAHANGTAIFGQLFHGGREIVMTEDGTLAVAQSASAVPAERYHVFPRAMPVVMINEIIASFGASAARLVTAGLDGCEILAGWGYLPSQFLSSKTNLREDDWGGDATRRQRFLREVLGACRAAVPEGFVVGVRISIGEASPDGVTEEEALAALAAYDADDLFDYVSVVKGTSGTLSGSDHIVPPSPVVSGYIAPLAARVKKITAKPVFLAGRINQPQDAENILAAGDADMCIMTRALITDPEMPAKAAEGRLDDIRACVGCNQACIGHFHAGYPISCIQFPETGRERFFPRAGAAGHQRHVPAAASKRVLVIGGGPAGLKAAAVAAERGHRVTLVEADRRLGGQVRLAQLVPGREEIGGVIGNLEREARAAGAELVTGVRADAAYVRAAGADVVIVATGATPYTPPLELMGEPTVLQAWDVLRTPSLVPAGGVVVADFRSDWVGLGLATMLAGRGHRVTLAVNGTMAGQLCQQYVRDMMTATARRARVSILTTMRVFGADTSAVFLQDVLTDDAVVIEDATLVLAYGHQPADALLDELEADAAAGGYQVVGAGDVLSPRTIEEAVLEGLRTAYAI